MKTFILLTLLFSSPVLFAQDTLKTVNGKTMYVYNNANDTLELNNLQDRFRTIFPNSHKDIVIKRVQIDGEGAKEIVIYRYMKGFISEHGGTFDIDEGKTLSKYEIWNVDTKQLLFSTISDLNHKYNRFLAYANPTYQKGEDIYSYSFSINNAGDITISGFQSSTNSKPDNEEGIYMFVEGKYILVK